jgi:demethylmenaquinone methyltransferase/2-methoxy-6-polyprenyl-1,4-benzoquinol methylase
MLDQARQNAAHSGVVDRVEWVEMGVVELDREPAQSCHVVMSGLCFSELTDGERAFALAHVHRLLEPGGLLLVADEVVPQGPGRRVLHGLVRFPLALLTYLLAQTTTRAVRALRQDVEQAGFTVESYRLDRLHSFAELVARKPV